ncbi:hypothetical protein [Haloplasma contractile]|uniref:DUF2157 domain-containing protein n=1 Tax=Haloplasma contractile SSD-17B TaxID=1033810 RepID=F7PUG0_9MOLU|nr:hypothetical protein [Haloplasma contractile]ERJ11767.1 hypothetical protein HLPCO_002250 [Haloplasma contractile SSD-17B]
MEEHNSKQELNHQQIFKSELRKMLNKGALNQQQYEAILHRYERTYKEPNHHKERTKEQNDGQDATQLSTNRQLKEQHEHQERHDQQEQHEQEERHDQHEQHEQQEQQERQDQQEQPTTTAEVTKRKHVNPKDTYQTMLLTIGVLLVLLAGVVFATTSWDAYDNFIKLVFLSSGSVIFFLASIIAEKKLKIEKTGLAFWSLGSLYIPILFLGIGFFGLFGDYLSLQGEGRYLLGFIATLVAAPIYYYSSIKYNDMIFSYVTLTCISLLFAFIGLQVYENILFMLLILSSVNAINLLVGKKIYNQAIIKYLNPYILANMILLSASIVFITSFVEKNVFGFVFYLIMIASYIVTHYKNETIHSLFSIFSGIMITLTGVYATHSLFRVLDYDVLSTPYYVSMFAMFTLFYFGLYYFNRLESLKNLKHPCLITMSIGITVLFVFNLVEMDATYNTIYLLISLGLSLLVYLREQANGYKTVYGISMYVLYVGVIFQSYFSINQHVNISLFNYFNSGYISLFLLILLLRRLKQDIAFIHIRILLVSLIPLLLVTTTWVYNNEHYVGIPYILMNHIILLTCFILYNKLFNPIQYERGMILIGNFVNITFTVFYVLTRIEFKNALDLTFLIATLIILLVSFVLKKEWRLVTNHYLLGSLFITLIYNTHRFKFNVSQSYLYWDWMIEAKFDQAIVVINFTAVTLALMILLRLIHKLRYTFLIPFALGLATTVVYSLAGVLTHHSVYDFEPIELKGAAAWIQIGFALILFILGNIVFRQLYRVESYNKDQENSTFTIRYDALHIDYYFILSVVNLFVAYSLADGDFITLLIIDLILAGSLFYQVLRTSNKFLHKVIIALGSYMLLIPYGRFINEIMDINHVIFAELIIIPIILVTAFICQWVFKEYIMKSRFADGVIVLISLGMLLTDVFHTDDLTNAILFFILTLVLIVYGYAKHYIAYFIIGVVYLAIFVLYETRNFWTNIPWWAYLLLAGLILIFISSLNEIEKRYEFSLKEKIKGIVKRLNK